MNTAIDNSALTEMNTEISENTPAWIDDGLEVYDVASIQQGGCASGAYMPAVTYFTANQTMHDHGDNVLEYLQNQYGELPKPADDESWSGMAVFYLSCAVECWANQFDIENIEY